MQNKILQRNGERQFMAYPGQWKDSGKQWKRGKPLARKLRTESTRAEALLWQRVRSQRLLGMPFRRQHEIGQFFVDLYCPMARLIVEVDGPVHAAQMTKDLERQTWLELQGLTLIRFTNEEIETDIERVVKTLEDEVKQKLQYKE